LTRGVTRTGFQILRKPVLASHGYSRSREEETADTSPQGIEDCMNSSPMFPTVFFRKGYDVFEVEAFVITMEARRADGTVTPEDFLNLRFSSTRLRTGYDSKIVDDWVDGVLVSLINGAVA
jgi:hypothetical protein